MATMTLAGLTALLCDLGLGTVPELPSPADPLRQPVDMFRTYLAAALQELAGCDPQQAYGAIRLASTANNGDLEIVVPMLRLPGGADLQHLASDLVSKVGCVSGRDPTASAPPLPPSAPQNPVRLSTTRRLCAIAASTTPC